MGSTVQAAKEPAVDMPAEYKLAVEKLFGNILAQAEKYRVAHLEDASSPELGKCSNPKCPHKRSRFVPFPRVLTEDQYVTHGKKIHEICLLAGFSWESHMRITDISRDFVIAYLKGFRMDVDEPTR